jgi:hypothetical protein
MQHNGSDVVAFYVYWMAAQAVPPKNAFRSRDGELRNRADNGLDISIS